VNRGLFFTFFLQITSALAVVAVVTLMWPRGWILGTVLVVLAGVGVAALLSRTLRQTLTPFEGAAAAIGTAKVDLPEPRFGDFDGLAKSVSQASLRVDRLLSEAAGSRRELEAMIDSMQDAVVAIDPAGRIQWTNQRMQRLIPGTSFSSAVRVGHALVQTIRDPEVLECMRIALEDRQLSERRTTSLLPGKIFEVAASPMPGGGAVAVLHDITRIEQVERTQREFVANVSHELRTPLTSITGYVETLLDHEASLSPQAREFLTTIHKNATRMNRLTEDLLVMARVESSEQELHPAAVRADLLVRDAVQAMKGMVQDEEAILEVGETTDCEVFADQDSIVQVLSNLIENAIKYGKARAEEPSRVVVSASLIKDEGAEVVEFQVRDFGQGIASEHLTRIFERFYRVDKARSRESGGTGLGLAIARHVVQTQGGTIRAESELNQGSVFLFTLPRAETTAVI
jgi:two-component system, OmpR family, phosphate regulon sensor histidine kinase PhoR